MSKSVRLICDVHSEIYYKCEDILNIDFRKRGFVTQLKHKLKEIQRLSEEARGMGQSMEDRLRDYHEGITDLGFKRVKK